MGLSKIQKILRNPALLFLTLGQRGFFNWMSDEQYLKIAYRIKMGKKLNLENPQTFNEKLQWLKLHDRRPEYTMMVDKYLVKDYVAGIIGAEHIIPTIGVWDDPDEIDFDALPERFVLKCNHNSGLGMCICKDKSKLNIRKVKAELRKGLKQNYYFSNREWPYKNVPRKIIAEQYMEDESGYELFDYKFMCFNGEVKCSFVCSDRFSSEGLKVTFYDLDWNVMPFERHYPKAQKPIPKPQSYEQMIAFAERLSRDIPFVRVDFYEINGQVYFGELTFYPGAGLEEFAPEEWDYRLGSWITLPEK